MWSKGNNVTTPNGEVLYGFLSRSCFYCPNLITRVPLGSDPEICQSQAREGNDVSTFCCGVPKRTLWMSFTCSPNLMFPASPWLEV